MRSGMSTLNADRVTSRGLGMLVVPAGGTKRGRRPAPNRIGARRRPPSAGMNSWRRSVGRRSNAAELRSARPTSVSIGEDAIIPCRNECRFDIMGPACVHEHAGSFLPRRIVEGILELKLVSAPRQGGPG